MSLSNLSGSSNRTFDLVEAGVYAARFAVICDQGEQVLEWQGEKSVKNRAFWNFELILKAEIVNQKVEVEPCRMHESGERPLSIGEKWTVTDHEKSNIVDRLKQLSGGKAIQPTGFDFQVLMGKPCKLTITNAPGTVDPTKVWPRIEKLEPYDPEYFGGACPPATEKPIFFDWTAPGANEAYEQLPDWLRVYATPSPASLIEAVRRERLGGGSGGIDINTELAKAAEAVRSPTVSTPLQDLDDDIPF